jgi:hypothetical protein
LLDVIDMYVDRIMKKEQRYNAIDYDAYAVAHPENLISREADLKPFAHIDDVMLRFYHLKRLSRPMGWLQKLQKKRYRYTAPNSVNKGRSIFVDGAVNFTKKQIVSCIKVMEQVGHVDPLIQLLHEVKYYKFIQDKDFDRELLMLLFITYKNIVFDLVVTGKKETRSVSLEKIIEIYERVEALPLEEILDTIDLLSDEIPELMEKYEADSELTWMQWVKKNWLAVPVDMVKLCIKVLLKFKPHHLMSIGHAMMGHHEQEEAFDLE